MTTAEVIAPLRFCPHFGTPRKPPQLPALRAEVTEQGVACDAWCLSCFDFRPPKSRKELPKTASKTLAGAGTPPSPEEAHTAAYKGIHGAFSLLPA